MSSSESGLEFDQSFDSMVGSVPMATHSEPISDCSFELGESVPETPSIFDVFATHESSPISEIESTCEVVPETPLEPGGAFTKLSKQYTSLADGGSNFYFKIILFAFFMITSFLSQRKINKPFLIFTLDKLYKVGQYRTYYCRIEELTSISCSSLLISYIKLVINSIRLDKYILICENI